MKRLLFNLLAGVSLILCLAMAAIWARSHCAFDQLTFESNKISPDQTKMTNLLLLSSRGELFVRFEKGIGQPHPSTAESWLRHNSGPPFSLSMKIEEPTLLHRLGFRFSSGKSDNGHVNGVGASWSWGFWLSAPYWFLTSMCCVLAGYWFSQRPLRQPIPGIYCAKCHYDLRATPDRCPECGTVPAGKLARQ